MSTSTRPTLEAAIATERGRRLSAKRHGRPYVYRTVRDGEPKAATDVWCDYCAGWFGVPHGHHVNGICRFVYDHREGRKCACIDCVVAERLAQQEPT